MFLIPFFMIVLIFPIFSDFWTRIIGAALFGVTAFTDFLDGHIARKYNLVTDFGKFLDPVVDKIMIFGAYLSIIVMYRENELFTTIFTITTFIVIFRETAVTSLRMITASKSSVVIAANWLGKVKTISQILCALVILLEPLILPDSLLLSYITTAFMTIMTVLSGLNYFKAYLPMLDTEK